MERFFSLIAVLVTLVLFIIIFKIFNKRGKRNQDEQERRIHDNSTELGVLKESKNSLPNNSKTTKDNLNSTNQEN